MDPTNTIETFAASVKNYVLQTLQTFYFLSQDVDEILTILINNDFDAKDTWWEMNDGSGEDYRWNNWEYSSELRDAELMMEFMVTTVGVDKLTKDDGMNAIRTRLSEIDFSNINYHFLSIDDSDDDSDSGDEDMSSSEEEDSDGDEVSS